MSRLLVVALAAGLLSHAASPRAQAPNVVTRESVVTATVDRIERATRVLTVRSAQNVLQTVYVDPALQAFDDLQVGDVVTVRYVESVVVQVRPNATLADPRDTTAEAKKAGKDDVVEQQRTVVTVDSIDPQGQAMTYRTATGQKVMRVVHDKSLLRGLHPGDRIEVTLTRERAISVEKRR